MKKGRFKIALVLVLSVCLIAVLFIAPALRADDEETTTQTFAERMAQWYKAQTATTPWGGTMFMGSYGPDYGIGEQGTTYQYTDPLTGSFVSYSSSSMGMGYGGPMMGYGGMFSPTAAQSYGPFAYGNQPQYQVQPTYGYNTQGAAQGSLWTGNEQYYQAQPAYGLYGGGLYGGGLYGGGLYGGSSGLYGLYGGSSGLYGLYGGSSGLYGLYGGSSGLYGLYGGSSGLYGLYGGSSGLYGLYGGGYYGATSSGGYPTTIY